MGISQDEMDRLLQTMSFDVEASADFEVHGEVFPEGFPCIRVEGRVLGNEAARLVETVGARLDSMEGHLFLDLTDCTFFSSVALGFVFELAKQRMDKGFKLFIIEASPQILKMIGMLGMRGMAHFCASREEAVRLAAA